MKIAILGAGSWGVTLGQVLSENGSDVCLWHHEMAFVNAINQTHEHPFLPGFNLDSKMQFTSSLDEIFQYGDMLISALPSQVVRKVL
ncbi:MAG: glycerol-3-phosphate dehydrogenase, partial [Candidatus Neomarinimicrobiota bacterium]|nr:glycerol-3-phosphate dehydrogenase [Candidatus Neomarinimicrobiota bacterium]